MAGGWNEVSFKIPFHLKRWDPLCTFRIPLWKGLTSPPCPPPPLSFSPFSLWIVQTQGREAAGGRGLLPVGEHCWGRKGHPTQGRSLRFEKVEMKQLLETLVRTVPRVQTPTAKVDVIVEGRVNLSPVLRTCRAAAGKFGFLQRLGQFNELYFREFVLQKRVTPCLGLLYSGFLSCQELLETCGFDVLDSRRQYVILLAHFWKGVWFSPHPLPLLCVAHKAWLFYQSQQCYCCLQLLIIFTLF